MLKIIRGQRRTSTTCKKYLRWGETLNKLSQPTKISPLPPSPSDYMLSHKLTVIATPPCFSHFRRILRGDKKKENVFTNFGKELTLSNLLTGSGQVNDTWHFCADLTFQYLTRGIPRDFHRLFRLDWQHGCARNLLALAAAANFSAHMPPHLERSRSTNISDKTSSSL